ncbi:MAG: M23 family metallopeptidase [Treponema sp.]|nr:M23 family metallopeptidase [Treponema sp.]
MKKLLSYCLVILLSSALWADTYHLVQKGETLYAISKKYQLTVAELRAANNLTENDVIKVGQKILIPTADITSAAALVSTPVATGVSDMQTKKYLVQKGDTFYGIAKKHNISLSELFALNGLGNDAVLKAGQTLKVPDGQIKTPVPVIASTATTTPKETVSQQALPDITAADPRTYATASKNASTLVWPVKSPEVTYVKGKVSGVQLSAQKNEEVTAIRSGTVMYCGSYRGFGQVVFVQSKTGLIYAYTGLGSISVKKGDYMLFGDDLGTAGIDTLSNKSQLTLMVFQNGVPIDPAKAPRG